MGTSQLRLSPSGRAVFASVGGMLAVALEVAIWWRYFGGSSEAHDALMFASLVPLLGIALAGLGIVALVDCAAIAWLLIYVLLGPITYYPPQLGAQKNQHTGTKVALWLLCILVLITAVAVTHMYRKDQAQKRLNSEILAESSQVATLVQRDSIVASWVGGSYRATVPTYSADIDKMPTEYLVEIQNDPPEYPPTGPLGFLTVKVSRVSGAATFQMGCMAMPAPFGKPYYSNVSCDWKSAHSGKPVSQ